MMTDLTNEDESKWSFDDYVADDEAPEGEADEGAPDGD